MKSLLQFTCKALVSLLLVLFVSPSLHAQVVKTESFDSTTFVPAGWSLTSGGNPNWVRRTQGPNGANIFPRTGAAMARFTVAGTPAGTSQGLVTPVIDYSGANGATPTFSMWMYRDSLSTVLDSVTVFVNTAPNLVNATRLGAVARSRFSVIPNNELQNGWYQYSYNIPASFNTATNYIILNGTSQGGSNMFVDDVQWEEYPTTCNGQPTAGSVTANKTLICGGSGTVNFSLNSPSASEVGIGFTWQSAPSTNGPWTDESTSGPNYTSGTLTSTTFFRCLLTCTNAGLTDSTAAIEITVSTDPLPQIQTSGNTTFCNGSSPVLLTATGALSYTWTPATGLSTTTSDSVSASPTNSTAYTVIGTDINGCTGSANLNVTVSNAPNFIAFANRTDVCPGDTTALRAQNAGGPGFGTTYSWNPGGLTGNNVVVTITAPITYTVVATNFAGCTRADSVTIALAVTVNPNFGYTMTNQTVAFSDSSTGAISWTWLFGDGNASFNQNPIYTYSAAGTYNVTLIVTNGVCSPDTIVKTIVISATGLDEINASANLSLQPNPPTEQSVLTFRSEEKSAELALINAMGQSVITKAITPAAAGVYSETLDISALPSGIYMVRITAGNENAIQRLIKR
jgi:PKD repeat protein